VSSIKYQFWQQNKGYEDMQADVFNIANTFKFQPASGDQIRETFEKEVINPKTVRYAFKDDKMVSYVQARIKDKSQEVHLSFPWAIPKTPSEIPDKLFDDMIDYLQKDDNLSSYSIRVNLMAQPIENIEFLTKRGFVKKNTWRTLFLSLEELASSTHDEKYCVKKGTEKDLDSFIGLFRDDGRYQTQFPTDDSIREYFDKVNEVGHVVLVYEGDVLTAASAPSLIKPPGEDDERIILRFTAFKDINNQDLYVPLYIAVAKECMESGFGENKPMLIYTDEMDTPKVQQEFFKKFTPSKSDVLMYYYYLE
jgi:hypothetical protein